MGLPVFPNIAEELRKIASRMKRLSPSRTDPEAYHVERDGIEKAVLELANYVEKGNP